VTQSEKTFEFLQSNLKTSKHFTTKLSTPRQWDMYKFMATTLMRGYYLNNYRQFKVHFHAVTAFTIKIIKSVMVHILLNVSAVSHGLSVGGTS